MKKSDCICQAKQFLYIFFFKKYDKYKRNFIEIVLWHDMGPLLYICCISSDHLFLRTPLEGYFCNLSQKVLRTWIWGIISPWSAIICENHKLDHALSNGINK